MILTAVKILFLLILIELVAVITLSLKSFLSEQKSDDIKREMQDLMAARSILAKEIAKNKELVKQIGESRNCGSDCGNGSKK